MADSGAVKGVVWKVLAVVFIIFDVVLTVALYIVLARQGSAAPPADSSSSGSGGATAAAYAGEPRPGADRVRQATLFPEGGAAFSIFAPLSPQEQLRVRNFTARQRGLKPYAEASLRDLTDAYIYLIELLPPRKADALAFLDGRTQQPPERTARVVVFNGARPAVEEWEVGPVRRPAWIRPLVAFTADNRSYAVWESRPTDGKEYTLLDPILHREMLKGAAIWRESFHAEVCSELLPTATGGRCLTFMDVAPRGYASGQRDSWGFFMRTYDGYLLHPLPLYLNIRHDGTDPARWRVLQVIYGESRFPSIDALVRARAAGELQLVQVPPFKPGPLYSDMRHSGGNPDVDRRGPTANVGHRYRLVGNRLTYMDWSAHLGMRAGQGLALFDLRFAGERIAYELSNQEAAVFYSGRTPISGICQYFDNAWLGMGLWSYELLPGVDCPPGATFLDTSFFADGPKPKLNRRAVCVFEWNTGTPLGRHLTASLTGNWLHYGGTPDHVLVIRQVAVVVNYDYVFDIILHLDGSVEVKISATGFLQTGYKSAAEPAPEVAPGVVGQLHQHLFNWKVDLDIKGQRNAFSEIAFPMQKVPHPAFPDSANRTILTHRYTLKRREQDANVVYRFHHPKYYVLHANSTDRRGYRLVIDNMAPPPLPPKDLAEYGGSFARYPLSVTRRKERTEDTASSIYSQNDPFYPTTRTSLARFYADNEEIVDQDLVAWVSQGVIHLPHTEDVPMTTTPTSTVRFYLQPYNFFKASPMTRSRDTLSLRPRQGGGVDLTTYVGHRREREFRLMANYNGTYFYP